MVEFTVKPDTRLENQKTAFIEIHPEWTGCMQTIILTIIATYGILAISHLMIQMILAYAHHRRWSRHRTELPVLEDFNVAISVIYPVYNESPEVLRKVLERARECLVLPQLEIIFIDDGSQNRSDLRQIYDEFRCARLAVYYQENRGKREAQYAGLQQASGDYIVTVDSDTLINAESIVRLVAPLIANPCIGAVCGEVGIENSRVNLLTRLVNLRYWSAFNLERAAQSCFGCVLCCSGPFSAYRAGVLETIKADYISQMFFGKRCTYGDDRHLTNLVLGQGYRVIYEPMAHSLTYCPETISEYITQQTRWNKSFYREMIWTLKIANRIHPYALIDMLMQPVLFIGFNVALSFCILLIVSLLDIRIILGYIGMLVVMASLRSLYGLMRTRNLQFLLFSLYGFLHVFVLIPVRFKSLLTLTDGNWGTRSKRRASPLLNFSKWLACYSVLLATVAGIIGTVIPDLISTIVYTDFELFQGGIAARLLSTLSEL